MSVHHCHRSRVLQLRCRRLARPELHVAYYTGCRTANSSRAECFPTDRRIVEAEPKRGLLRARLRAD